VFVALDGVAQKRQVKVGIIEKWHVQVTEGLEPGEKIVVEGHRDVEDGQEIEVIQVITDPGSMQL
jgi:membrane fusion protein (multidrug efflux system)